MFPPTARPSTTSTTWPKLVDRRHARRGRCTRCFFFDARHVKIGVDAVVGNEAIYLVLGYCPTARVRASTQNDVLHWTKR